MVQRDDEGGDTSQWVFVVPSKACGTASARNEGGGGRGRGRDVQLEKGKEGDKLVT